MRRSRAPNATLRGLQGTGAHREASGGGCSVLEGSKAGRRRRWRLEREKGAWVRGKSGQTMTKTEIRRYLRVRRNTADLRVASTSMIVLGKGKFAGGGEIELERMGKGEEGGPARAL